MRSGVNLSDLALSDVEALADGDSESSDCKTYCSPANGYTCIVMWQDAGGITYNDHRKG